MSGGGTDSRVLRTFKAYAACAKKGEGSTVADLMRILGAYASRMEGDGPQD